jgi:hypothetical protein
MKFLRALAKEKKTLEWILELVATTSFYILLNSKLSCHYANQCCTHWLLPKLWNKQPPPHPTPPHPTQIPPNDTPTHPTTQDSLDICCKYGLVITQDVKIFSANSISSFRASNTLTQHLILFYIYYFIYLRTELSPSWEAANCAAIQKTSQQF